MPLAASMRRKRSSGRVASRAARRSGGQASGGTEVVGVDSWAPCRESPARWRPDHSQFLRRTARTHSLWPETLTRRRRRNEGNMAVTASGGVASFSHMRALNHQTSSACSLMKISWLLEPPADASRICQTRNTTRTRPPPAPCRGEVAAANSAAERFVLVVGKVLRHQLHRASDKDDRSSRHQRHFDPNNDRGRPSPIRRYAGTRRNRRLLLP